MNVNPNKFIKFAITESGREYITNTYKMNRGYLGERDRLLLEFSKKPLTWQEVKDFGVMDLNECFRSLKDNGFVSQQQ